MEIGGEVKKMKPCCCDFPYPNENMERENYWKCIDDYICVRNCNGKQKTKCVPIEEGVKNDTGADNISNRDVGTRIHNG